MYFLPHSVGTKHPWLLAVGRFWHSSPDVCTAVFLTSFWSLLRCLPALYESDLSLLPQQFLFKTCLLSPMVFISSLDIVGILYRTYKHLTIILSLTIPVPQILGGSVGFCWFSDSWCLVSLCVEWTSGATSCTVGLNLWPGSPNSFLVEGMTLSVNVAAVRGAVAEPQGRPVCELIGKDSRAFCSAHPSQLGPSHHWIKECGVEESSLVP